MSKLDHLEGIRGVCALLVFYIHFMPKYAPKLLDFVTFYQPRYVPVPLFFILSGRVLTASVLKHKRLQSIGSSIVRRPFRLGLPIIGVMILNHIIAKVMNLRGLPQLTEWSDVLILPFHFMMFNGPIRDPLPGVSWTISHEFHGSILVYFLTYLVLTYCPEDLWTRMTIFSIVLFWHILSNTWLTHFIVGLMLADLAQAGVFKAIKTSQTGMIVAYILFAWTMYLTTIAPFTFAERINDYLRALMINTAGGFGVGQAFWESNTLMLIQTSAFMLLVEVSDGVQNFFSWKPFVYLGRVSFSLYLFHMTYIEMLGNWLLQVIGIHSFFQKLLISAVTMIPLLLISEILTRVIDEPTVKITKMMETLFLKRDFSQYVSITTKDTVESPSKYAP